MTQQVAKDSWRATGWYMLVGITLANTFHWADRQVILILFPGLRGDLALSDTELGILGGFAFSVIYAIASFGFGHAADRHIRKNLIAFGLFAWSVATAAGSLADGFWGLFASRFFTGVGAASVYPSAMSLIGERYGVAERGKAMGVFNIAAAVGGGLGVGLGGAIAQAVSWRTVFAWYGLAGLFLVPVVLSIVEKPRPRPTGEDDDPRAIVGRLLRDRRLLIVWMAGLVMIASGVGYGTWVPSYFQRYRDFDVAEAGYFFGSAMMVGGIAGSLLGGVFADRRRRRRFAGELDVPAVTALAAVPLVILTLTLHWAPGYFLCGLLAPVAIFAFFPALQTIIVEVVPPRQHGLAYAINILFLGGIGNALGPFLIGLVSDLSGTLEAGMVVVVVGMLLAAGLSAYAGRLIRRLEAAGQASAAD